MASGADRSGTGGSQVRRPSRQDPSTPQLCSATQWVPRCFQPSSRGAGVDGAGASGVGKGGVRVAASPLLSVTLLWSSGFERARRPPTRPPASIRHPSPVRRRRSCGGRAALSFLQGAHTQIGMIASLKVSGLPTPLLTRASLG